MPGACRCSRGGPLAGRVDGWSREAGGGRGGSEPLERVVQLGAQSIEADAAEVGRACAEAAQGARQQRSGAGEVAPLKVVEGGGHLDEGLEKVLLGLAEGEPDGLPVLMGEEIFAAVVAGEAFGERSAGPVKECGAGGLWMRIGDEFRFHWRGKSAEIEVL